MEKTSIDQEVALEPQMTDRSYADATVIGDISLAQTDQLERGLKSRHIQFLALGGACVTTIPSPLPLTPYPLPIPPIYPSCLCS